MDPLAQQAIEVLRGNDRGTWTRPSPRLYPHQWSWDAAFISLGWAQIDPPRALAELRHLFEGQWDSGMVPHIVFDKTMAKGDYEPGPAAWATNDHSPAGVATSGICQPPVHAIALHRLWLGGQAGEPGPGLEHELRAEVERLYPALVRWHEWLHRERDPEQTGLITLLHPWESGMDNSPRWDRPLEAVDASRAELARPDLTHVADPSERPTDDDYRQYHHLVECLVALDYDQSRAMTGHPFRVTDVFFSAILAAAEDALAELAKAIDRLQEATGHTRRADRIRQALDQCWDPELGRCVDQDRTTGEHLTGDTIAGFAPLIAGCDLDRSAILVDRLAGRSYAGADTLVHALPPSTAITDPAFDARGYWRGPQWPPVTWLLWWGMQRAGHRRSADRLRRSALDQLRQVGCTEYVNPLTGAALGSPAQSWTAAVALDWLAHDDLPIQS